MSAKRTNGNGQRKHGESVSFEDRTAQFRNQVALTDTALIIGALLVSVFFSDRIFDVEAEVSIISNLSILPIILFMLSYFLYRFGAYTPPRESSLIKYVFAVAKSVIASFSILLGLLYILKIRYISSNVIVLYIALVCVSITLGRVVIYLTYRRSLRKGECQLEVLIVGTGNRARFLSQTLMENTDWGVNIVGYLDVDPSIVGMKIRDRQVIGTLEDIHDVLKSNVVDEVIVAIPRAMIPNMENVAFACDEEGVCLRVMADFFDVNVAKMRLVEMGSIPLLTLEPVAHDETKLLCKRIMDFLITFAAMPLLAPVMLAVAIAVKLDSAGPVFFIQPRVGKNKRIFRMYKFRSMVADGEKMMKQLEHLNEAEGPIFKIANDPRITRVGRFIRKTSLDELPQLFNVLRGEMSLVGPRPMSVRDVDLFDKGIQRKRFSVKPGLTCLWQISGRSNLPFEKWLELDLKYIETWSLATDFKILLKTIPVVVNGSGAV